MSAPKLCELIPSGVFLYEFGKGTRDQEHFIGEAQPTPRSRELSRIIDMLWNHSTHFYIPYPLSSPIFDLRSDLESEEWSHLRTAISEELTVPLPALEKLLIVDKWLTPQIWDERHWALVVGSTRMARASDIFGPEADAWCTRGPALVRDSQLLLTCADVHGSGCIISIFGTMELFQELRLRPTTSNAERRLLLRGSEVDRHLSSSLFAAALTK